MAWIKRNLFFVIFAAIAVGLLGVAGFYGYKNWQRNQADLQQLNQTYATLQRMNSEKLLPGNDRINNIKAARQQEQELRQWIRHARQYFRPILPVPDSTNGPITDAQFAAARDYTLSQLQAEATNASVTLPAQYAFSFAAEQALVKFAPHSLPALAQQLGDVKAICEVLYAAKVNSLVDIRRVPVSADDTGGPQADYLSRAPVTNNLAILTPYQVTFRGFSQNLATVLSILATSRHGFIVSGINVQPASSVPTPTASPYGAGPQIPGEPPAYPTPAYYNNPERPRYGYAPTPRYTPTLPRSSGGLQIVINEQLLSITLDIKIVKLLPGK